MINLLYLKRAFAFLWKNGRWWLFVTVALTMISGLLPLAMLWNTKELINEMTSLLQQQTADYRSALGLLLLQFFIAVLSSMIRNLKELTDQRIEIALDHRLQEMVSKKMASVPLAYFDLPEFYNHHSRIQGGLGQKFLKPARNLFDISEAAIRVVSLLGFLLSIHWSLLLVSLLAAIPLLIAQIKMGNSRFWMMYYQAPTAREARYLTSLLTDRQTAKEVRLFGLSDYLLSRWSNRFLKNAYDYLRLMTRQKWTDIGLDAVTALFYGASAIVIIWLARFTPLTIGEFVAIGQAVQGSQGSINMIARQAAKLHEDNLYLRDFYLFMEFDAPSLDAPHEPTASAPMPRPLRQGIRLEHVSFSYPGSQTPILQDVSFLIRPGEKVAIVGENGSGKTTLVKCLLGLYNIQAGRISFDGIDIRQIRRKELRRSLTVIFQDFIKYSFTVRDNIAFGDIQRREDSETILRAARSSGADDFVSRFEKGYDTFLGRVLAHGEDLSGGQWQKIAIARALFRGGDVIILDEPTAALDPQAEMALFEQFRELTTDKTALFISHRMSAARIADKILVMKEGRLVEVGSHEELYAQQGDYYQMYQAQAKWYTTDTKDLQEVAGWKS